MKMHSTAAMVMAMSMFLGGSLTRIPESCAKNAKYGILMPACSSTPAPTGTERTLAYGKIFVGANQIGWIEKRENLDPDGLRTVVDLVKDMKFDVRGYIHENGRGVKVETMTPAHREALGEEKKIIDLPGAARDHLVRMMFDLPVDAKVMFTSASSADFARK